MKKRIVVLMFCAMLIGGIAQADVTVPTMFSDHAVLQRNMSVPVWGTASPGEQVTVEFGGQSKTDYADEKGDWTVTPDPKRDRRKSQGDRADDGHPADHAGLPHSGHTPVTLPVRLYPHLTHRPLRRRRQRRTGPRMMPAVGATKKRTSGNHNGMRKDQVWNTRFVYGIWTVSA